MDTKKVIKFCKAFGVPMYKICVEKNYNIVSVQSLIEMVKTLKKCGVKFKTIPLKLKPKISLYARSSVTRIRKLR